MQYHVKPLDDSWGVFNGKELIATFKTEAEAIAYKEECIRQGRKSKLSGPSIGM